MFAKALAISAKVGGKTFQAQYENKVLMEKRTRWYMALGKICFI